MMLAAVLACSDDSTSSSVGDGETGDGDSGNGDGDGESNSGDGDGDSGDGDGDSGDGDGDSGDGDGDSGDGDGDGDGDSGDGDGDGDGDSGDGDGESGDGDGDGDGDGECDPNAFIGQALANTPWGEGDLCDEIWVCATQRTAQTLMDSVGVEECTPGCESGDLHCTLSWQTIVSAEDVADACSALEVEGIDEVYCVVYGP